MKDMLERYFHVTDKEERKRILTNISEHRLTDQETIRVLNYLWKLRYDRKLGCIIMKDAFLDSIMQLLAIDNMLKSGIGWKKLQKQVFQIAEVLGLDDFIFQSKNGSELFIKEYENLAIYFVNLGKNDRFYGKGILKLSQLEHDDCMKRVKKDFNIISQKIPDEFGFSKIYMPFKKGLDNCINKISFNQSCP